MDTAFWERVDASGDCWLWTGGKNSLGYGLVWRDGRGHPAHRWAYQDLVGPIPKGLVLDHLCRNPRCVNPDHVEPVTQAENLRRGYSFSGINARRRFCKTGEHELTYDGPNKDGTRRCYPCALRRWREKEARKRAARKAQAA